MEERRQDYAEFQARVEADFKDLKNSLAVTTRWLVGIFAAPFCLGLIAWGVLSAKVDNIEKDVEGKANKETVDSQFAAVNQSLGRIEATLSNLTVVKK